MSSPIGQRLRTAGAGYLSPDIAANPVKFDTLPQSCLVDANLLIRVLGLRPGERISLKLWSIFHDLVLQSSASFVADAQGVVDLGRQAPVSGSYQGVDAMGLFWSRRPVRDELAREFEGMSREPLTATLVAHGDGTKPPIAHAIRRVYMGAGVVSRDVREQGLVARLYEPAQARPQGIVLGLFCSFLAGTTDSGLRPN